jgi:hypothetical protein
MFETIVNVANNIFAWGMPFSHVWGYLGGGLAIVAVCAQWKNAGVVKREPLLYWMGAFLLFLAVRNVLSPLPSRGYGIVFGFFAHWMWPFILGFILADAARVRRAFTISICAGLFRPVLAAFRHIFSGAGKFA